MQLQRLHVRADPRKRIVHVGRMEGMRRRERRGGHSVLAKPCGEIDRGLSGACDDTGLRAVDGGKRELRRQQCAKLGFAKTDRDHRSRPRRLHQPPAHRDQPQGIRKAHDLRDGCRNEFTQTVTDHGGRLDSPRDPLASKSPAYCKKGRLGVRGIIDAGRPGRQEKFADAGQVVLKQRDTAVDLFTKDRSPRIELASHAGPLAARPGNRNATEGADPPLSCGGVEARSRRMASSRSRQSRKRR